MKNLAQFVLIAALLVGVFGCSAESSEKVAADARVKAADARVDAADADARVKAPANPPAKAVVSAARTKVVIPSGTLLKVSLIDALNSDTSSAGDRFLASLAESVVINGATLLQKGTKVRGRVIEAEGSGRVKGRASIRLALTDIVQGDRMVAIITDPLNATADSSTTRDAEITGTGVVLATKGKEVRYDSETRLNFTLTNSVEM